MSEVSKSLFFQERILFESLPFQTSDDTVVRFKALLPKFPKKWVQSMLYHAGLNRPLSFKFIANLLEMTGKLEIEINKSHYFAHYLFLKKIAQKANFSNRKPPSPDRIEFNIEQYENPIAEGSLWWYILSDDLKGFTDYVTSKDIDFSEHYVIINSEVFDVIDLSCYCAAINILKYLIINNNDFDFYSLRRAVQSGSEEIIEFLVSKGQNFDNMLDVAVDSHQNSICRWLYENFSDKKLTLPFTLLSYNTEMFFFFYEECNWDINQQNQEHPNSLRMTVLKGDMELCMFILEHGGNVVAEDIELAQNKDIKKLLKKTLKEREKQKK